MIASHLALKRVLGFGRCKTFLRIARWPIASCWPAVGRVLKLCRLDDVQPRSSRRALSYGEEKMLGVAMAMMCEPKLLLLDEPASGLGQEEIRNLGLVLRDLREHGTTLCIIDHKVAFLAEFADRLIALQNGKQDRRGRARARCCPTRRDHRVSGTSACWSLETSTAHYGKIEVRQRGQHRAERRRDGGTDRRERRGQVHHHAT